MVQENSLKKIVIICGATASGKTSLAVEFAKRMGSEIISADSMCVYKSLDIGTAKPTAEERNAVKHYMIDVVSPEDDFSVSDYKRLAEPVIKRLHDEGKIPIICGGTGFYINALLYDLSYGNGSANLDARDKYKKLCEEKGNLYVYEILKEKDPLTAEKLHFNDVKRVIRALEIYENGEKKSDISDEYIPKYDYRAFCVDFDRETLYKRINERVDSMIKSGLVEEVRGLTENGITDKNQCMQGIGYKEIYEYIRGFTSLEEATEKIKLNTRHYAKRQITFFKKLPNLIHLPADTAESNAERIIKEYDR